MFSGMLKFNRRLNNQAAPERLTKLIIAAKPEPPQWRNSNKKQIQEAKERDFKFRPNQASRFKRSGSSERE
jgi:hypothetical protein